MAITVEIGGAALPAGVGVVSKSLGIGQEIFGRSTLAFKLLDETGLYRPEIGEAVEIYDGAALEWAGVLDQPEEVRVGPGGAIVWSITATDNHALADNRTVAESFDRQVAGDIVTWIITNVLSEEGITAGTIEDGPEIAVVSPHLYASQLLNEIADTTGMIWRINHDKSLDFVAFASDVAAAIDENSDILASSVKVWQDRGEYRNRQVLRNITGTTAAQPGITSCQA